MQNLLERTETAGFAEFVAARSGRLLRVAYLLTRDWALAEDLLQTSLAKTWSAWRRIEGDPEPYVRKVLVNTYTTWWRRRWHHELPTDTVPERPGADRHRAVDDRDQILRALGRLPRQQRAVLVLRYYEDQSEVEIAEALGISPGTVKSHAFKGLANLRLDASLAATHLRPDSEAPEDTARLAGVTERVHQRRRQRVTVVVATCAVVLAAILGYAIKPAHRSAPQPATTPSPRFINGFPEYQMGTQLATVGSVSAARTTATLTWSAATAQVTFFVRCASTADDVTVWIDFTIGTTSVGKVGCAGTPAPSGGGTGAIWPARVLSDAGLEPGLEQKVTVRITSASTSQPEKAAPVPADFVADIAVGEAVPPEKYPFPPRPTVIQEMWGIELEERPGAVGLYPSLDPLAPVSADIVWGDWDFASTLDAPGEIVVSVNGVTIQTCAKWDYAVGSSCLASTDATEGDLTPLKLRRGEHVTLTVTPVRVGNSWAVVAAPHVAG